MSEFTLISLSWKKLQTNVSFSRTRWYSVLHSILGFELSSCACTWAILKTLILKLFLFHKIFTNATICYVCTKITSLISNSTFIQCIFFQQKRYLHHIWDEPSFLWCWPKCCNLKWLLQKLFKTLKWIFINSSILLCFYLQIIYSFKNIVTHCA